MSKLQKGTEKKVKSITLLPTDNTVNILMNFFQLIFYAFTNVHITDISESNV